MTIRPGPPGTGPRPKGSLVPALGPASPVRPMATPRDDLNSHTALYTYANRLNTVQRTESSHQNTPKHRRDTVNGLRRPATAS